MLVLTRKVGESLLIGDHIEIKITEISGDKIKIGIEAPMELKILRKELYQSIVEENQEAAKGLDQGELESLKELFGKLN